MGKWGDGEMGDGKCGIRYSVFGELRVSENTNFQRFNFSFRE
jgi:hypothetical protein